MLVLECCLQWHLLYIVYTEGKIPPGVALLSVIMRQAIRQCLIAQEMNLQTGCIKAYASAVGKQITSKLGELAMKEAAQQWRFKDDVDAMVDKMQDLEAMLHDADDRLHRGGMDREVVGRSICSALHRPLDLHRPTLAARSAPPQKSTGTSSRGQCMCAATPEGRKGKVGAAPVKQGNGFTCSPVIGMNQVPNPLIHRTFHGALQVAAFAFTKKDSLLLCW